MGEILTQQEIDDLLQSLNDGSSASFAELSASDQKIRAYDFRTANRIPRDQMRTLHSIYDTFSRVFSTYLTGTLGVLCDVDVVSLEEQTFQEFVNSTPTSSLLAILKMEPLHGPTLLQVSPEVAYAILECLLGGSGMPAENRRLFTEIDLVIMEKIIRQILPLNSEAWDKIVKVTTTLDGMETSMQFAQIVQPSEIIVIVTIKLQIGTVEALINFCLPQIALEPVAKNLNTRLLAAGRSERHQDESHQDSILEMIRTTPVALKAILSETTITINELMNLQVGDVIQLDSKLSDHMMLKIGHIPRLEGVLGSRGNRYAVRITGINYEEEADYE